MRHFLIEAGIDAPPDAVWAVMRDVERWHEWTSTVTNIRLREPGSLRVGSTAMIQQPKLPPALWKVIDLDDAGRSFTWVTRSPGVEITARHGVSPAGQGSRARLSLDFAGLLGGLVGRLTKGINERYLAIEAKGLKARCEAATRS